jgi:hypothetical protein
MAPEVWAVIALFFNAEYNAAESLPNFGKSTIFTDTSNSIAMLAVNT